MLKPRTSLFSKTTWKFIRTSSRITSIARTLIIAGSALVLTVPTAQAQACPNPPPGNIVFEWTNLLLAVSGPGTSTTAARNQGNQVVSRNLAMMEAAIYDSVNAIDKGHSVYLTDARYFAYPDDSAEAAAAQAAHDVAAGLYNRPAEIALFDSTLARHLCPIPDGPARNHGIVLGQYVATQMLLWRAGDGSTAVVPYSTGTHPGDWQPTPPNFAPTPATPQWGHVKPFALTSGSQFRPGPPPALTSADYTEAFQEVQALGGNGTTTPSTRTPEQTEIALFWAGVGVTNAAVAIWNQIAETVAAEHNLTLIENARLFALMNVTIADSYIAGFDAKYTFNDGHGFWRPVTAIRAANTDGNEDTVNDPTWTPLIVTVNHPSYVSLHAAQSQGAGEALAAFFGTDHVPFTATWAGVERSFQKFSAAAHEAAMSRIYAGIHWSFDAALGRQMGRKIGSYVADNFFLPASSEKRH